MSRRVITGTWSCAVPGCVERNKGLDADLFGAGWRVVPGADVEGKAELVLCPSHAEIVEIVSLHAEGRTYRRLAVMLASVRSEMLIYADRARRGDREVATEREAWRIFAAASWGAIGERAQWPAAGLMGTIVAMGRRIGELEAALSSAIDLHERHMAEMGADAPPTLLTWVIGALRLALRSGPGSAGSRSSVWWRDLTGPQRGEDGGARG